MTSIGRRPGRATGTQMAILAAARTAFATKGYNAASLRHIAAAAGVDPALPLHYFGSKRGLFAAAIGMSADVDTILEQLHDGDMDTLGERFVRLYLSLTDAPSSPVIALLRSATSDEESARVIREFITEEVVVRLIEALEVPDRELRVTLVGAQLVGIAVLRRVVGVEPLASADPETVVAWVAPTLQRYLTAPSSGLLQP